MATKSKIKKEQPVIYDVVNEVLDLPEDQAHLCAAETDEPNMKPIVGKMRLMLNRDVLDIMRDIVDELEMSRDLPVDARDVAITDAVVIHILQNEKIDAQEARMKAMSWYDRQKKQAQNDALIIALTLYNEFNVVPTPYKPGEMAFSVRDSADHRRRLPAWMQNREKTQIPPPERHMSNHYEIRLKQIYDIATACGSVWALQLGRKFEEGVANTIRLIEPRDDAGFPNESSGSEIHAESESAD